MKCTFFAEMLLKITPQRSRYYIQKKSIDKGSWGDKEKSCLRAGFFVFTLVKGVRLYFLCRHNRAGLYFPWAAAFF